MSPSSLLLLFLVTVGLVVPSPTLSAVVAPAVVTVHLFMNEYFADRDFADGGFNQMAYDALVGISGAVLSGADHGTAPTEIEFTVNGWHPPATGVEADLTKLDSYLAG